MKQIAINDETHKKLSIKKLETGRGTLSDTVDYLLLIESQVKPDKSVFKKVKSDK